MADSPDAAPQEALENLLVENRQFPPSPDFAAQANGQGAMYDEAAGDPEHGIAAGTAWEDVPMNWTCPECGARKEDFEMVRI